MNEFDTYIHDTYGFSVTDLAAAKGQDTANLLRAAFEAGHETGRQSGWSRGYLKGQEISQSSGQPEPAPTREALIAFVRSMTAARRGADDEPSSEDQEYLTWAADDAVRLLGTIPHQVPVTRKGSGFSVDLTAMRHAIANGATTLTFTAPEGWHFEDDRRLHPDNQHDDGDLRTLLTDHIQALRSDALVLRGAARDRCAQTGEDPEWGGDPDWKRADELDERATDLDDLLRQAVVQP